MELHILILILWLPNSISVFTCQSSLSFQLMVCYFFHCLFERGGKVWIKQGRHVFVRACVCQTSKIISCIRKYGKYNLRMLDQSEAKPWVSDAIVNEWKTLPSHSTFCTWPDEAVIQKQEEAVQPLPHYTNTLSRQSTTKGWGQEGYSSPRFPNKSTSAQHFT